MLKSKLKLMISLIVVIFAASACSKTSTVEVNNLGNIPRESMWYGMTLESFAIKFNALASKNAVDKLSGFESLGHGFFRARPGKTIFDQKISELINDHSIEANTYFNNASLILTLDSKNQVRNISVHGSKSDPVNREEFNAMVEIVGLILNPSASAAAGQSLLLDLGLAGTVAEPIGQILTSDFSGSRFVCLYKPKGGRKGVVCEISPTA